MTKAENNTLEDTGWVPKSVAGVDLRSLAIGPTEAFVFSRVNDRSSIQQLSHATGLPTSEVVAALLQLVKVGAVAKEAKPDAQRSRNTNSAASGQEPMPTNGNTHQASSPDHSRVSEVRVSSSADIKPRPSNADEAKTEVGSGLDQRTRGRIDDLLHAAHGQTLYELLGVLRNAHKREIKQAYYKAVGEFHPDRFFGIELGEYKSKAERVVNILTRAHDTLTRKKRRAEYDATLPARSVTPEGSMRPSSVAQGEQPVATRPTNTSASQPLSTPSSVAPPSRSSGMSRAFSQSPSTGHLRRVGAEASSNSPKSSAPPLSNPRVDAARREQLARKLGASMRPLARTRSSDSTKAHPKSGVTQDRSLQPRQSNCRAQQFSERAQAALDDGNAIAAANSFRLALALDPEDLELKGRLEEAEALVDKLSVKKHMAEAQQAKAHGNFSQAARSFSRAARGKSQLPGCRDESAELYLEAADCARTGYQDLKQAREYAKQAVSLNPKGAREHFALGQIYAEAGMRASALSELQLAQKLRPNDANIEQWLKRVRRGDV